MMVDGNNLSAMDFQQSTLLLHTIPDPVVAYRNDFSVMYMNQAALKLFAIDAEEKNIGLLMLFERGNVAESILREWQQRHNNGEAFQVEMPMQDERTFAVKATPLDGNDGADWLAVFHDISPSKTREALHTQMIQIVSHDLKNPLNIIIGLASVLEMDIRGEQKQWVQQILHNTRRMETLITNLLNIEKINAGYMEITEVDPCNLITALVSEYSAEAGRKGQSIETDLDPCTATIQADHAQLHHGLGNLLSNAIKYTPTGGKIEVNLRIFDHVVQFVVSDTGVGIPLDAQERLFEPFYRVQNAATRGIPGTGLGLSLAKSIVDAHNGRIWVESVEGEGTTFVVELPIAPNSSGT